MLDKYTTTHINYHYTNLSTIDDYSFTEISGIDSQTILNSAVVHNYNESTKRFNIDFSGNIDKVRGYVMIIYRIHIH